MTVVAPVAPAEAEEKAAETFDQIKELLGTDEVPAAFLAYARVPAFLQDFVANFKKFLLGDGKLQAKTRATIGLAVAAANGGREWTEFFAKDLKANHGFDDQGVADVIAVVATNAMYNTFFKFRKMSGTDVFDSMGVGLRAHTFRNTSVPEPIVELIAITLSNLNACEPCVQGHLKKAHALNIGDEQILEAIQVASVIYGGCVFLKAG